MIVMPGKIKVAKSGKDMKYKKGYIPLTVDVMTELGWKNKDIILVIADPKDRVNITLLGEKMEKFRKIVGMERDIARMKKSVMGESLDEVDVNGKGKES